MPLWGWALFAGIAGALLALDFIVTTGRRAESRRWALLWRLIWVGTGLLFAVAVWLLNEAMASGEYLTDFLLEKSLSLDNLFVFLIVFSYLGIPRRYQRNAVTTGSVNRP
jgi:tellurite resistance protein TerC